MRRAPPVIQQFNNDLDNKFKEYQGEIDNKTNILFKVTMKSCGACKSKAYLDSFALLNVAICYLLGKDLHLQNIRTGSRCCPFYTSCR